MTRIWYDLHPLDAVNHICDRISEIEEWLKKQQLEWIDSNIGRNKTNYWFKKNEKWTRELLEKEIEKNPWVWTFGGWWSIRQELDLLNTRLSEIMKYHDSDMRVNIEFGEKLS